MKKLSEINEGFWKDGIKRAKNNIVRQEDKIDSNVYDLKEIDLGFPFLVANEPLTIEGKDDICYSDFAISDEKKKIEKLGWRIPRPKELEKILFSGEISTEIMQDGMFFAYSLELENNNDKITLGTYYGLDVLKLWCPEHDSPVDPFSKIFSIDYSKSDNKVRRIETSQQKYWRGKILLIKDKKQINEGFWKDSIKRAKSGEERLEDKHHTNIERLIPIDLGVDFYFADIDFYDGDECEFTYEDALKYKDFFAKYGWRIPDYDDFHSIDFDNKQIFKWRPTMKTDDSYVYNIHHHNPSSDEPDEVFFDTELNNAWKGWLLYDNVPHKSLPMEFFWKAHYKIGVTFHQMRPTSNKRRIRLIRDKRNEKVERNK